MINDFINSLTFGEFLYLEIFCLFVAFCAVMVLLFLCILIYFVYSLIVSKIFGIDLSDVLEFGRICKESDHTASWVLSYTREFINNYDKE